MLLPFFGLTVLLRGYYCIVRCSNSNESYWLCEIFLLYYWFMNFKYMISVTIIESYYLFCDYSIFLFCYEILLHCRVGFVKLQVSRFPKFSHMPHPSNNQKIWIICILQFNPRGSFILFWMNPGLVVYYKVVELIRPLFLSCNLFRSDHLH